MTQPDPDFVAFFAGDWQRLLESVEIPGVNEPSWDRRAAYLLWRLADRDLTDSDAMLAFVKYGTVNAPIVGNGCNCYQPGLGGDCDGSCQHVNPIEEADCTPDPEGVGLQFDSKGR